MEQSCLIHRQEPLAADAARVLARFRTPIDVALGESLALDASPLYDMLRFHIGLDGEAAAGGKALRPTLCLLVCEALGGHWPHAMPAAVSLELVHNFSLIHDDIQDEDLERHHRPTVWAKWGVAQAINAGDAMFCLATLHLETLRAHFDDTMAMDAVSLLHEATREMIQGQYLDVSFEVVPEVGLDDYLRMISYKTGALLRASIELGALLAKADDATRQSCRRFGEATGRLFQIKDDILGVWGLSEVTGKPVGADIKRKKKSLPIVIALSKAAPAERRALQFIYGQDTLSDSDVANVQDIFGQLDVRSVAQTMANEAHERALALASQLDFSHSGRAELLGLVEFLLARDH